MTTILIVEDDDAIRTNVTRMLKLEGYDIVSANNGRQGLECALAERPDLIISDIGMPEMDGFELIAHLRALESQSGERTPAIALTAFAQAEDRTRAMRAGYQTYLGKPVEPAELVATIASFTHLVRSRRDAQPDGQKE